jgi:6-phosphogluconolactonase (cycloisomerase 2 family)/plastocyanin
MKNPFKLKVATIAFFLPLSSLLSARAATVTVQVGAGGRMFTPQNVTIQAGDTVQWRWATNGHSTTSGTPGHPDGMWDSGVQRRRFVFNQTFPTAGTFNYFCTPHGACCGMIGAVTVQGAPPATGAMFINGNGTVNEAWMYNRGADGQLSLVGSYATQGTGAKFKLSSQNSIMLSNDRNYLYVANANSNDVTAFKVQSTGLTFLNKVPSGGTFPNSIAVLGNLVYVLNSKGTVANVTGFNIQADGSLAPLPNSTRLLSSARPESGQVGFTPDGKFVLVTEKDTDNIDTYAVQADGLLTGPTPQHAAGNGPFGFAFDGNGYLVDSEILGSSASSYTVTNGVLQVVTAKLKDFGKAACWAACTSGTTIPQQYAYISNTNSDSISGYAVAANGTLSLLTPDGRTFQLPQGAFPLELVISNDNQYLSVLEGNLPGVAVFQIQSNGSLVQIQALTGIPASSSGMIGY